MTAAATLDSTEAVVEFIRQFRAAHADSGLLVYYAISDDLRTAIAGLTTELENGRRLILKPDLAD